VGRGKEYGLPFTRSSTDATGSRFLSTEVADCDAAGNNCVAKRSTYLRYEQEPPAGCVGFAPGCYDSNRRVKSQRIVYHDDSNRYADTDHSAFDGLGHYRTTTTGGNFPSGNVRATTTNYNPGVGTLNLDANGNILPGFTMLGSSAPWVLETYTEATQTESGVTAKQQFCFDASTGFLLRQRTYKSGTSPGTKDVVQVFTQSAGNRIREQSYGGDVQTLSTSTALCSLTLPTDAYRVDHTYQYGALATSQYRFANGTAMSFKLVENTIDFSTGLVSASRDLSGGLLTAYEYDAMGRLTWTKPPTGHGSWVEHAYTRATSSSALANVHTRFRANGSKTGTIVAEEKVWFDALGKVWKEEKLLPSSTWSTRETLYDGMGHKKSVSEWGNTGKKTQFLNYDAFGRPTRIRPPDGSTHDVTLAYTGDRVITRNVKVGTTWTGTAVAETTFSTTERYDRQGRLYQLLEASGVNNATTTTTYGYDVGNRLKSVSMPSQSRTFNYDTRGFLTSEVHPETGTITYGNYDARGHAGTRSTGAASLAYTYDRAERLIQVQETAPVNRTLKSWTYSTANSGSNYRNGKVLYATRNNYVAIGATPFKVSFQETFTYAGRDGRVSQRVLSQYTNDGAVSESFTQSWTYDVLGNVISLGYPDCTLAPCTSSPRTVSNTYTKGFLTGVTGFASSLTYHPNLQVNQVTNANGVVTTYAMDPNHMARPASIATTAGWSTGAYAYAYDGAGNVTRIGNGRFLYDGVSRLVEGVTVITPADSTTTRTQTVGYDLYGNIQSITTNGAVVSTPTNTANRLTSSGTFYDAAGSMTSWNWGATFQYDALGLLWHYTSGAEDWLLHVHRRRRARLGLPHRRLRQLLGHPRPRRQGAARVLDPRRMDRRPRLRLPRRQAARRGHPPGHPPLPPRPPRLGPPGHQRQRRPGRLPRLLPLRPRSHHPRPGQQGADAVHRPRARSPEHHGRHQLGRRRPRLHACQVLQHARGEVHECGSRAELGAQGAAELEPVWVCAGESDQVCRSRWYDRTERPLHHPAPPAGYPRRRCGHAWCHSARNRGYPVPGESQRSKLLTRS
jgi:hypothetical protein